jgi:cytochrome d ubiquinol oxidase subunit I
MILISVVGLWHVRRRRLDVARWFLTLAPLGIALPYIANTTGWLFSEMGRQPWVVFGLMKTSDATSGSVGVGFVAATLIGFSLIYGVLSVVDVLLLTRFARSTPPPLAPERTNGSKPTPTLVY